MPQFQQSIESAQPVAAVIISVALMLFAGFALTRITKLLRLPNVTAYKARVAARPKVQEALKKEGLLKAA